MKQGRSAFSLAPPPPPFPFDPLTIGAVPQVVDCDLGLVSRGSAARLLEVRVSFFEVEVEKKKKTRKREKRDREKAKDPQSK